MLPPLNKISIIEQIAPAIAKPERKHTNFPGLFFEIKEKYKDISTISPKSKTAIIINMLKNTPFDISKFKSSAINPIEIL